jgi:hypothetical protein
LHVSSHASKRAAIDARTRSRHARALLLLLLAFAVFWNVERLAHVVGEEYAAQIIADPGSSSP